MQHLFIILRAARVVTKLAAKADRMYGQKASSVHQGQASRSQDCGAPPLRPPNLKTTITLVKTDRKYWPKADSIHRDSASRSEAACPPRTRPFESETTIPFATSFKTTQQHRRRLGASLVLPPQFYVPV